MTRGRIYAISHGAAHIVGEPMIKLANKLRGQHLAMMRQEWCWLMRQVTGLSYPKIGELINRDHATVMYAVDKVEKMFQNGSRTRLQKNLEILRAIGAPPNDLANFDPPVDLEAMSVGALRASYGRRRKDLMNQVRLLDLQLANLEGAVEGARKLKLQADCDM